MIDYENIYTSTCTSYCFAVCDWAVTTIEWCRDDVFSYAKPGNDLKMGFG